MNKQYDYVVIEDMQKRIEQLEKQVDELTRLIDSQIPKVTLNNKVREDDIKASKLKSPYCECKWEYDEDRFCYYAATCNHHKSGRN